MTQQLTLDTDTIRGLLAKHWHPVDIAIFQNITVQEVENIKSKMQTNTSTLRRCTMTTFTTYDKDIARELIIRGWTNDEIATWMQTDADTIEELRKEDEPFKVVDRHEAQSIHNRLNVNAQAQDHTARDTMSARAWQELNDKLALEGGA